MREIGAQPMIDLMRSLGVESHMDPYPSICLGTTDITLFEMVGAYTAFANQGVYSKPFFITRIEDKYGNILEEFSTESKPVLSEQTAYVMVELMRYIVKRGTAVRLWLPNYEYKLKSDIGGKTGTTQNHSDGWFMGYTPQLVAGAWVGGEDRFMRFDDMKYGQGASSALPIWALFFKSLYANPTLGYDTTAVFEKPKGRLTIELDCSKYDRYELLMQEKDDSIKAAKGYGSEYD